MEIFLITVIGLCCGSFAGVLAGRYPNYRSIIFERSRCDTCHIPLTAFNLIPVISFAYRQGRCRCKATHLSWSYPVYELIIAIAALSAWWQTHSYFLTSVLTLLAVILLAITVIDFASFTIPNLLSLGVVLLGCVWFQFGPLSQQDALLGTLIASLVATTLYIFTSRILHKPALGFGDVKLMTALGLWIGFDHLPVFLILAGSFGVLTGIVWQVLQRGKLFPFGPALAGSAYVTLLLQLKG